MLHILIGTAAGALVGGAAAAIHGAVSGDGIDWGSVAAGAAGGAATGALASATFGAGLLAGSAATQAAGMVAAGASGGAVERVVDNVTHDREWHDDLGEATAIGGALGAGGAALRAAAPALRSPATRSLGSRLASGLRGLPRRLASGGRALARGAGRLVGRVPGGSRAVGATKRLWGRYLGALDAYPIRTKSATSGTITLLADLLGQKLEGKERWDWKRTVYRTAFSAALTPVGHYWLAGLDKWFPAKGLASTLKKVALDQLLMSPFMTSVFLGSYGMVVEGRDLEGAWGKVKEEGPGAVLAGWAVWPGVKFAIFKWVPLDLQIPAKKVVSLAYNTAFGMLFLSSDDEDDEEPAAGAGEAPAAGGGLPAPALHALAPAGAEARESDEGELEGDDDEEVDLGPRPELVPAAPADTGIVHRIGKLEK